MTVEGVCIARSGRNSLHGSSDMLPCQSVLLDSLWPFAGLWGRYMLGFSHQESGSDLELQCGSQNFVRLITLPNKDGVTMKRKMPGSLRFGRALGLSTHVMSKLRSCTVSLSKNGRCISPSCCGMCHAAWKSTPVDHDRDIHILLVVCTHDACLQS